jgi:transposase
MLVEVSVSFILEAIIAACPAFIQFCREIDLISGRLVALDGTKMGAVASPVNAD